MAHVVVLGAGLGGTLMAYEMKEKLRPGDTLTVVTRDPKYHFVPSNPWVAVGWRKPADIEVDLAPILAKKGIAFKPVAAAKLDPANNRIELADGSAVDYDYLINATGPDLAFDEIEGLGPQGHTQSVCHVSHAEKAAEAFEAFCKNPGPIVVGAVQGASCFGPAYEFLFILETELRRRKIRDKVPMTFVTAEPYIGHLGLDGVGDTKGLLESEMRSHHIKWMTSTRVKKFEAGKVTVEEIADDGTAKAEKELPFGFAMMLPAFRGVAPLRGIEGLSNPRGFTLIDKFQRNPEISEHLCSRGMRCHPSDRPHAGSLRRAEDRLHDRVDGDGDRSEHRPPASWRGTAPPGDMERRLPRRLRRLRRRLCRPAADPAAERQLVIVGQMGARRQDRLREILPAQGSPRHQRDVLSPRLRSRPARSQ